MMENLERAGCPLDIEKHFKCIPCDDKRSGGFSTQEGILICENQIMSKQHLQDTMTVFDFYFNFEFINGCIA